MYKVSVPGSLVLLGEHAVLNRAPALGLAVDKRIAVTLTPRTDNQLKIQSPLGTFCADIAHLQVSEPFQFVINMILKHKQQLKSGFELEIVSDFSHLIGFGSSAAVTLGAAAVLQRWLNDAILAKEALFDLCHSVIKQVQGQGSGLDLATSLTGGLICYQAETRELQKLMPPHCTYPDLLCVYSGEKMTTKKVLAALAHKNKAVRDLLVPLYQTMGQCSLAGVDAIQLGDWLALGRIMDLQHGLLNALGVSTLKLEHIVDTLRRSPQVLGAKISGAGLGDSVLALGRVASSELTAELDKLPGCSIIPIQVSHEGLIYE